MSEPPKPSGAVVTGYERMAGVSGLTRPRVKAVSRDISVDVVKIIDLAEDVVGLTLEAPDGRDLPPWRAGAHLDVILPSGTVRQYSLCGNPARRDQYRIAVRRIPAEHGGAGGSLEVHALTIGTRITLRGPRNAFAFITVPRYLFVAGGIGITPILPMVRTAISRGADWALVYTGRTRDSMAFVDELDALDPARVHIWPDDEYGIPDGKKILSLAPEGAALYTCGPPAMIATIRAEVPSERIETLHFERFSAAPVIGGTAFDIVLSSTGETVHVGADQTALAALREVRPAIAYSCQQGSCGTCPVRYLDGEIEHKDSCLPDAARSRQVAICVSRANGTVTLDL